MKSNTQNFREKLKQIPSVDELILYCIKQLKVSLPKVYLKKIIKIELEKIKGLIVSGEISSSIKKNVFKTVSDKIILINQKNIKSIINGTGIVLHTGFGRAPIDKNILIEGISDIYPYSNLEYDIINNKRGERNNHINSLISALTYSESSLIVNNNAAAVMLVLNTFSENKEVVISRGELVEIGGSFRIPDVINKSNCKMVEVGTTNKTHINDYKKAINKNTGMIMIAHTSNYKVVGFTESVDLKELVLLAKKNKIPLFVDVGSGALINYNKFEMPKEKMIKEYIKMGVDVVSFSGDKLIGGPQAGVICGKKNIINKIHANSMYRALRCDKITVSIFELILKTYIDENSVDESNLAFYLLTRKRAELKKIGKKLLKKIKVNVKKKYNIHLVESYVQAGSGSLPIENIESIALEFKPSDISLTKLSYIFRSEHNVIGYIKNKSFYIDLKAIPNDQFNQLIKIINIV